MSSVERPTGLAPSVVGPRRRRSLVLGAVVVATLVPIAFVHDASYRSSPDLHAAVEMLGASIALIAGLTFLVRFNVLGSARHLLFGLAFLANGATDVVHGLVPFLAERGAVGVSLAVAERVVPATFVAGRTMMVSLLVAALFVRRPLLDASRRRRLTVLASVGVAVASGALTWVAFLLAVPEVTTDSGVLNRPQDLLVGLVFLAAAFLLNRAYGRTGDALTWWVALAAALAAAGQFAVTLSALHDPLFDLAHLYKAIGYALPLLGLSLHHVQVISERDRYAEDLERHSEAQQEFVSIVSHELRTPLAGIAGFGGLLEESWAELSAEERSRYVSEIVRQADRLNRLVNDLLAMARLGSKRWPVRLKTVEVDSVVKRAVDACGSEDVDVVVDDGLEAVADPDHLERIVLNLVDNALKHGQPPVVVAAVERGSRVEVLVRDHGPGVPADFRERLFAPFAQAESGTSRRTDGAGLGLAIVRGLAEAQGAWVRYEDADDGGAVFVVSLRRPEAEPTA